MKKNILLIMLLVVVFTLVFTIIRLQKSPKATLPQSAVIVEETKGKPQEQAQAIDTEFLKYGITPREAKYYE